MILKPDAPPLYGLVLAGGKSTRMGRDKAGMNYHGRPQLDVCFELLGQVCEKAFVSARADHPRGGYPQIYDLFGNIGPIDGIRSALRAHPGKAWLVIGCDLPFLNRDTLDFLVARRNPRKIATAFVSANDGLPEPLCAIYEPAGAEHLSAFGCPRKALINGDVEKLALPDPRALDNVNTPEEFATATKKTVHVQYFAALREERGTSGESVDTPAATVADLYDQLALVHPRKNMRVALNDEFVPWDHPLRSGDVVIFVPPTAGG